jgi:hypothetical protein
MISLAAMMMSNKYFFPLLFQIAVSKLLLLMVFIAKSKGEFSSINKY